MTQTILHVYVDSVDSWKWIQNEVLRLIRLLFIQSFIFVSVEWWTNEWNECQPFQAQLFFVQSFNSARSEKIKEKNIQNIVCIRMGFGYTCSMRINAVYARCYCCYFSVDECFMCSGAIVNRELLSRE